MNNHKEYKDRWWKPLETDGYDILITTNNITYKMERKATLDEAIQLSGTFLKINPNCSIRIKHPNGEYTTVNDKSKEA